MHSNCYSKPCLWYPNIWLLSSAVFCKLYHPEVNQIYISLEIKKNKTLFHFGSFQVRGVFQNPNGYLALEDCCFCKALSLRDSLSECISCEKPYHVTCSDGKSAEVDFYIYKQLNKCIFRDPASCMTTRHTTTECQTYEGCHSDRPHSSSCTTSISMTHPPADLLLYMHTYKTSDDTHTSLQFHSYKDNEVC